MTDTLRDQLENFVWIYDSRQIDELSLSDVPEELGDLRDALDKALTAVEHFHEVLREETDRYDVEAWF